MMEAARTSETSVDNYFTRQYIPEDKSELHTHCRENLKSHKTSSIEKICAIMHCAIQLPQRYSRHCKLFSTAQNLNVGCFELIVLVICTLDANFFDVTTSASTEKSNFLNQATMAK
jgi:hypothetical protein